MKTKHILYLILITLGSIILLSTVFRYFSSHERSEATIHNDHVDEHLHDESEAHDDHDHDGHDQQKSSMVTVWGDRFEIFLEHPFVVANTPTAFVTHITDRSTLQPRRKGAVTFVLTDESNISTRHVERSPARDGIYIPRLTFPQSGRWRVSLVISDEGKEHVVELPALKVYSSQNEVDRDPTPEEVAGISFLKEQQWKIPFETKAVHQRNIRSQAVLAVSASTIVDEDGKPVAFVQLAGETFKKRYLKLGQKEHGFIQILSGLSEGEYLVTQGAYAVAEAEHHKDHDTHGHGHDDHDHEGHGDDSIVRISKEDMKRFGIEIDTAEAGGFDQHISVPGEIVINSDRLAHIVPHVSGVVQQVKKNLGDFVKKGEIMAVIGSRELADAKAAYLTSIERFNLAEPLFEREERLWKKKISPEQDFLDAKTIAPRPKLQCKMQNTNFMHWVLQ